MVEDGTKTLVVGIDGACADVIDPLVENGVLPNLSDLRTRGTSAPLESQVPPTTASAWTSLYTGTNPGQHGIFTRVTEGTDRRERTTSNSLTMSIWRILSLYGKRSVIVNAPITNPSEEFCGALIPGREGSNHPGWTPKSLKDRYEREVGPYRTCPDPREPPLREYPRLVRMRGDAFCYLASEYDPSFGFIVFDTPEHVLYQHPDDEKLLATVYSTIDDQLGRIIERFEPSTTVVASDHGMARCEYTFRINEFLRREGFVEPAASTSNDRSGHTRTQWRPVVRASSAMSNLKHTVRESRLGRRMIEPFTRSTDGGKSIDYDASVAYMRSWDEPGIRINCRGRDTGGGLPADDYEHVREDVIDTLSTLRTPTGEPMFDDVSRSEAYFWGSAGSSSTDIVAVPHSHTWSFSTELGGSVFTADDQRWRPGFQGIITMAGDTVDADAELADAHLFDVAPTVLASLEVPVSDKMDGDVLPAIPATDRLTYPTPGYLVMSTP